MRQVLLAMCWTAATALAPACALAQTWQHAASYPQRPEPPIAPSIPVPDNPPAAKPQTPAPKPMVRRKIVHRIAKVSTGPLTMPSPEILVIMVRGALAAVNQANFTENYSVLHGMATPALQTRVSANQFGKVFAALRQQNLDLSPLLVMTPRFTTAPVLTPEGVLRLVGFFPSRPLQIDFALDYRAVDGYWLIDSLSVKTSQANAAAPQSAPKPTVTSIDRQTMTVAARPAFWDRRFVRATFFGPRLSFASNPR